MLNRKETDTLFINNFLKNKDEFNKVYTSLKDYRDKQIIGWEKHLDRTALVMSLSSIYLITDIFVLQNLHSNEKESSFTTGSAISYFVTISCLLLITYILKLQQRANEIEKLDKENKFAVKKLFTSLQMIPETSVSRTIFSLRYVKKIAKQAEEKTETKLLTY